MTNNDSITNAMRAATWAIMLSLMGAAAAHAESKPHALGTNLTSGIKTDKSGCPCDPLDDFRRAGNPQRVSKLAQCSNTWLYGGYYVGGGAPWHGEPRQRDEGTWDWDYWGYFFKRRVALRWYHGRKEQGGGGDYRTDGPHLVKKE